ncbi:hypothetical protein EOPP23_07740 [Endozoicomonas sp. OPT23]|uniref:hypothetical protein n=1 Tax=Endozoicomonas sp. OPT23 TaxID=2072845 RepID=UPI00129B28B1|nr:hypothetical protein [Endozoicomonas sp. OPT23]MRI32874.1 hypothetical protein [Endozoicomonas sp. OPT23]
MGRKNLFFCWLFILGSVLTPNAKSSLFDLGYTLTDPLPLFYKINLSTYSLYGPPPKWLHFPDILPESQEKQAIVEIPSEDPCGDDQQELPTEDILDDLSPESLKQKMVSNLDNLSQQLNRRDGTKLVLVFDLDNSLISSTDTIQKLFSLDQHTATDLQQDWLNQLADFTSSHSEKFIVIYNTSRSIPKIRRQNGKQSNYPIDLQSLSTRSSANNPMVSFQEKANDSSVESSYAIPRPDVLISSHGLNIEFTLEHDEHTHQITQINEGLMSFYREDHPKHKDTCTQRGLVDVDGASIKWNSGENYCILTPLISSPIQFSANHLQQPDPTHVFSAVVKPDNVIKESYIQSITLNKGTSLRIVTQLLIEMSHLQTGRFLIVTVGDSHLDLPMLRPDLEAKAAGKISQAAVDQREQAVSGLLGGNSAADLLAHHWLLSINTDPDNIPQDLNSYTRAVFDHKKIITLPYKQRGLPFVIENIVESLSSDE